MQGPLSLDPSPPGSGSLEGDDAEVAASGAAAGGDDTDAAAAALTGLAAAAAGTPRPPPPLTGDDNLDVDSVDDVAAGDLLAEAPDAGSPAGGGGGGGGGGAAAFDAYRFDGYDRVYGAPSPAAFTGGVVAAAHPRYRAATPHPAPAPPSPPRAAFAYDDDLDGVEPRPPRRRSARAAAARARRQHDAADRDASPAPLVYAAGAAPPARGAPASRWGGRDLIVPAAGAPRGEAGLVNMGNTCYMNSTLQCLAHCARVARPFLDGAVLADLNPDNPLGQGGRLATATASLFQKLWAGGVRSVTPAAFREALVAGAPQFGGHAQHDAQELLAFLMDGLHEDLNRVKIKPYTQLPDSTGRPDPVVAAESWAAHKARNDSIVVDACQGLLKSNLHCPACGADRVSFDPFLYLSLPLPPPPVKRLLVRVIAGDGRHPPTHVAADVPGAEPVSGDVARAVGAALALPETGAVLVGMLQGAAPPDMFWHDDDALPVDPAVEYVAYTWTHAAGPGGPAAPRAAPVVVMLEHADPPARPAGAAFAPLAPVQLPLLLFVAPDPAVPVAAPAWGAPPPTRDEALWTRLGVRPPTWHFRFAIVCPDGAIGAALQTALAPLRVAAAAAAAGAAAAARRAREEAETGRRAGVVAAAEAAAAKAGGGVPPGVAGPVSTIGWALPKRLEEAMAAAADGAAGAPPPPARAAPPLPVQVPGRLIPASKHASLLLLPAPPAPAPAADAGLEGAVSIDAGGGAAAAAAAAAAPASPAASDDGMDDMPIILHAAIMDIDMASPLGEGGAAGAAAAPRAASPAPASARPPSPPSPSRDAPDWIKNVPVASQPGYPSDASSPSGEASASASAPAAATPAASAAAAATPAAAAAARPPSPPPAPPAPPLGFVGPLLPPAPPPRSRPPPLAPPHAAAPAVAIAAACPAVDHWGRPLADATPFTWPPPPPSHDRPAVVVATLEGAPHQTWPVSGPHTFARHPSLDTPPPPPVSLPDCLAAFTAPETMGAGDEWRCSACGASVRAVKTLSLWSAPDTIVVHLKRFAYEGAAHAKLTADVDYPVAGWDLEPHLPRDAVEGGEDGAVGGVPYPRPPGAHLYDLFAAVCHYGSAGAGHYTAVCALDEEEGGAGAGAGEAAAATAAAPAPARECDATPAAPAAASPVAPTQAAPAALSPAPPATTQAAPDAASPAPPAPSPPPSAPRSGGAPPTRWAEYDDCVVTRRTAAAARTQAAYVLFYRRRGAAAPALPPPVRLASTDYGDQWGRPLVRTRVEPGGWKPAADDDAGRHRPLQPVWHDVHHRRWQQQRREAAAEEERVALWNAQRDAEAAGGFAGAGAPAAAQTAADAHGVARRRRARKGAVAGRRPQIAYLEAAASEEEEEEEEEEASESLRRRRGRTRPLGSASASPRRGRQPTLARYPTDTRVLSEDDEYAVNWVDAGGGGGGRRGVRHARRVDDDADRSDDDRGGRDARPRHIRYTSGDSYGTSLDGHGGHSPMSLGGGDDLAAVLTAAAEEDDAADDAGGAGGYGACDTAAWNRHLDALADQHGEGRGWSEGPDPAADAWVYEG